MKRLVLLGVCGFVLFTSLVSGQTRTPQDLRNELLAILDNEPRAKYPGKTSCATWIAARREGTGADAIFVAGAETIPQRIDTYCQAYPDSNVHRMVIELLKAGYPRPAQ
jgi:hypothetical protein